jgi:hypothetical protein
MTLTLSQRYPVEMLPVRVVHLTRNKYAIIDTAARLHHGEYGRYNFPRPGEQPAIRPSTTLASR